MILLGTPITAAEASAAGLVADVFEPGTVLDNVLQVGSKLASMSATALSLAKEAVCRCKQSLVPVSLLLRLTRPVPPCAISRSALSPAMLTNHDPVADDLGRDDNFERSLYYFAFGTQDKREGVGAFLDKRAPNWSS